MTHSDLSAKAQKQGLTLSELQLICKLIGREPNDVELGIFAVLWSEHCSYKSSKIYLKNLPTQGPRVVQGPGENAGMIDIGDDHVLAFKVESHNHPSFIEPHQGAATGVGGILRDIFTVGARPVAVMDSLHFGSPSQERMPYLVHGVVGGISAYGNSVGIPNLGGEVFFRDCYNGNILVNAFAMGVCKKEDVHKAISKGEGNWVVYLGATTGKDGVHGATMASDEFKEGSEDQRPTVQAGDPFTEKLVMEATLEILQNKWVVGIQDMGAAGVACSTFEMSDKGQSGMKLNLNKIPLRSKNIGPYEIFLSESQERMLLVCEPQKYSDIKAICTKWGIECEHIGEVTNNQTIEAYWNGEKVVDLPVGPVTSMCPLYSPETERPLKAPNVHTQTVEASTVEDFSFSKNVEILLASNNLSSRKAVFRQYDSSVGSDTVVTHGSDAGVIRIKGFNKGIAMSLDSNSAYSKADPYLGVQHVVCEGVRNLACTGARAVALTNCLNFGSPQDPEIMGQFKATTEGLSKAALFFDTPITGGNVSLYNQTQGVSIFPTPTIGTVGLMKDAHKALTHPFKSDGAVVMLLGKTNAQTLYDSEFGREILKEKNLQCPPLDLQAEKTLQTSLLDLIDQGLLESAHDCSEGGVFMSLFESCVGDDTQIFGLQLSELKNEKNLNAWMFAENPSRAVISFAPKNKSSIEAILKKHQCAFQVLGRTQKEPAFIIDDRFNKDLKELLKTNQKLFEQL